jgi:hypothetical protein
MHRELPFKSAMNRVADKNGILAATLYWRSQPFAGAAACCHSRTKRFAHRVMPFTPQSRVRGHVGLKEKLPKIRIRPAS